MRRGRHSRSIPQAPPCGLCFLGKWLMSYDLKRNLDLKPTNRPSVGSDLRVHPESHTVACERCEWRVHLEGPRRVVLITVLGDAAPLPCGQVNTERSVL